MENKIAVLYTSSLFSQDCLFICKSRFLCAFLHGLWFLNSVMVEESYENQWLRLEIHMIPGRQDVNRIEEGFNIITMNIIIINIILIVRLQHVTFLASWWDFLSCTEAALMSVHRVKNVSTSLTQLRAFFAP